MFKLFSNTIIRYFIVSSIFLLAFTKSSAQAIDSSLLVAIHTQEVPIRINGFDNAIFHYVEYLTANLDTINYSRICMFEDPAIDSFNFNDTLIKNRISEIEIFIDQKAERFTFLNEKEIEELINGTNKYGSYDDNKYDIIKNKHLIEGAENLYKDADLDKIQYISKIAIAKTKIEKLKHQNNKLARSLINHNTAFLKIFIYDDYVESAIVIRIHVVDAHSKMLMSKHKKCMDRILFVNSPTNMIDHPIEFREIEPKY